jgi:hypothetical protein
MNTVRRGESNTRPYEGCIVLAAATVAVWLLLSEGLQPSETAHNQFRHARNLAVHGRLAFNLTGPPVLANESPLYIVFLAIVSRLFDAPVDQVALSLNAFFLFWLVVISYWIARHLFGSVFPAVLAAIVMTLHSSVIAVLARGYEQGMLLCVTLSAFYLLSKRRMAAGLLLASIAPLIANEGIASLLTALLFLFFSGDRKPWYFVCLFAAPLIWIGFSSQYYGSIIPHSLLARHRFHLLLYPYQPVWLGWSDWITGYLYNMAGSYAAIHRLLFSGSMGEGHFGLFAFARLAVALCSLAFSLKSIRKTMFLFPVLFILLVPVLKAQFQSWATCVALGMLIYFFVCCRAWSDLIASKLHGPKLFLEIAGYLILFVLFQSGSRFELNPWADPILTAVDPRGSRWAESDRQRYNGYRRAAEYLKKRGAPDKLVLSVEAGFLGYAYAGEIFDASGYCTPSARRFYPPQPSDLYDKNGWRFTKIGRVIPSPMIDAVRPDYIVAPEATLKHLLQLDSDFLQKYTHLTRAGLIWGSWLSIYERFHRRVAEDAE